MSHSSADFAAAQTIERAFAAALRNRTFSGAAMLVGSAERILFHRCWGTTHEGGPAVDQATRFDLASLTKPLVTALLCAVAIERRLLTVEDSLEGFFAHGFVPADKRSITIRQLLAHCSGLPAYRPFYRELIRLPLPTRHAELLKRIMREAPAAAPGTVGNYSDLGFIVLGAILQTVLQGPLDQLADRFILQPLAITELGFFRFEPSSDPTCSPDLPTRQDFRVAATELCPWRRRLLQGEVHDENAYCLGGVAAHAGLFGTATGVYRLLAHLLASYRRQAADPLINPDLLETFRQRQKIDADSTRALGFDTPSAVNSSAGRFFSARSVGHLGFTGTSFWMDLEQEVIVVLLTNRVYPTRDNERIREFRPLVHNLAMKAYYESLR